MLKASIFYFYRLTLPRIWLQQRQKDQNHRGFQIPDAFHKISEPGLGFRPGRIKTLKLNTDRTQVWFQPVEWILEEPNALRWEWSGTGTRITRLQRKSQQTSAASGRILRLWTQSDLSYWSEEKKIPPKNTISEWVSYFLNHFGCFSHLQWTSSLNWTRIMNQILLNYHNSIRKNSVYWTLFL